MKNIKTIEQKVKNYKKEIIKTEEQIQVLIEKKNKLIEESKRYDKLYAKAVSLEKEMESLLHEEASPIENHRVVGQELE